MAWIPATITAGGELLGGLFGNSAQHSANVMNRKLQREQQDWEERMSGTAHQREVKDLQAAGLNPMLSLTHGGASTPSVSAATVQPEDAMAKGIGSAAKTSAMMELQAQGALATIRNTNEDTRVKKYTADTGLVTSGNAAAKQGLEMLQLEAQINQALAAKDLSVEQRAQIQEILPYIKQQQEASIALLKQQSSSAGATAALDTAKLPEAQAQGDLWKKLGATGKGANFGANALRDIISIIRSMQK